VGLWDWYGRFLLQKEEKGVLFFGRIVLSVAGGYGSFSRAARVQEAPSFLWVKRFFFLQRQPFTNRPYGRLSLPFGGKVRPFPSLQRPKAGLSGPFYPEVTGVSPRNRKSHLLRGAEAERGFFPEEKAVPLVGPLTVGPSFQVGSISPTSGFAVKASTLLFFLLHGGRRSLAAPAALVFRRRKMPSFPREEAFCGNSSSAESNLASSTGGKGVLEKQVLLRLLYFPPSPGQAAFQPRKERLRQTKTFSFPRQRRPAKD